MANAVAIVAVGAVFVSVMTGNAVLFGVALGGGSWSQAARPAAAIIGFSAAAFAAAVLHRRAVRRVGPPQRQRVRLQWVEFALLLAAGLAWFLTHGEPVGWLRLIVIALLAAAMGLQSAIVINVAPSGVSTTYMTGTLTAFWLGVPTGHGPQSTRIGVIVSLIIGAIAGGLVLGHWRSAALLGPPAILLLVTLWAWVRQRPGRPAPGTSREEFG